MPGKKGIPGIRSILTGELCPLYSIQKISDKTIVKRVEWVFGNLSKAICIKSKFGKTKKKTEKGKNKNKKVLSNETDTRKFSKFFLSKFNVHYKNKQ